MMSIKIVHHLNLNLKSSSQKPQSLCKDGNSILSLLRKMLRSLRNRARRKEKETCWKSWRATRLIQLFQFYKVYQLRLIWQMIHKKENKIKILILRDKKQAPLSSKKRSATLNSIGSKWKSHPSTMTHLVLQTKWRQ